MADEDSTCKKRFDAANGDSESLKRRATNRPKYSPAEIEPDLERWIDL